MRVLSTDRRQRSDQSPYRNIWISEACILSKHAEPESVVLAVGGTIYSPDAEYLQEHQPKHHVIAGDNTRCAGVIEATDYEMQILAGAGYRLNDLRNSNVLELTKILQM